MKIEEEKKILNGESCRKWREKNKDKILKYQKKYYKEHKEEKELYYEEHKEEKRLYNKEYNKKYKYKILKQKKEYNKTIAGKERTKRSQAKRKGFGYISLNNQFLNSEGHHLNINLVLHIPKELHKSIYHRQSDGLGMKEINSVSFEWLATQEIL